MGFKGFAQTSDASKLPIEFTDQINLSTNNQGLAENLQKILKKQIFAVIDAVKANNFNFSAFTFERNSTSGLTSKAGFYLILNKRTGKVYFGCTGNLSQRKGEHKKDFKNNTVSQAFSVDTVNTTVFDDFYFVPLLVFPKDIWQGLKGTPARTRNQEISEFLASLIEEPLLRELLNSSLAPTLYNVKSESRFTRGNTFGGSPNSGSKKEPVCYDNVAWASVTLASTTFSVTRRLITNKRDFKKLIVALTQEEFNNFSGVKIATEDQALLFATQYPVEYSTIKSKLFPNKK